MSTTIAEIAERTTALEKSEYKLKTWLSVLSALGVAAGAAAVWFLNQASDLEERLTVSARAVAELESRLAETDAGIEASVSAAEKSLEESLAGIDSTIKNSISAAVDRDFLLEGYSSESVISQIQAQAICTAIAPKPSSVMAVYRSPTGKDHSGKATSAICSTICPNYVLPGRNGKKASEIGSIHIYSSYPPAQIDGSVNFPRSTATFIYHPSGFKNPGYGPNYCCCGG